jgi:hypothetical protein
MTRAQWLNLKGLWDYSISSKSSGTRPAVEGQILVPFPLESALSGVKKPLAPDQQLWYRRTFTVPAAWKREDVLLHFGAVDWHARIFMNGKPRANIEAGIRHSASTSRLTCQAAGHKNWSWQSPIRVDAGARKANS